MKPYPLSVLRTVALHTQGLDKAGSPPANRDELYGIVNQIGCLQIDTLQVVNRSHYLVLWSRVGNYDTSEIDILLSSSDRRLFEGWQHAASIIPLTEYRYQLPHQRDLHEHPTSWYNSWLNETVQKEIIPGVLQRIRTEGALKVSDFESNEHRGGTWWNWRPAKVALEFLYGYGELMIAGREKFQRIYDVTERVLPKWVDKTGPTVEERDRFWVERGSKSLGVFLPRHAGDYTWMKVSRSRPIVEALIKEGILIPLQGIMNDGNTRELFVHRDNLYLLEKAADGELRAERTTFLSPFDNLWWANRRDEQLWGFHQSLEAYLPATKRVYGYFCMPILHKDRMVGRFDPKVERKSNLLRIKGIFLEPGVAVDEELIADIAKAMQDFMAFHSAHKLVIEKSEPEELANKLMKVI